MSRMRLISAAGRTLLVAALLTQSALSASAQSQAPAIPYEPTVGQQGKDVVWVPTGDALVQKMLDLANVTDKDYVIDLGSGDGRTVIAAAKRGATAHGIEYEPEMVALSKKRAEEAGLASRATFEKADLFTSDFSKATVITMFLLPSINEKLRPQLLNLPAGTRIVSNTFTMGTWEADEQATVTDCENWCTALLWIVPAKVDGTWQTPEGPLVLTQEFQVVNGTLNGTAISGGRLRGDTLVFTAGGATYTGRVSDKSIAVAVSGAKSASWTATKP
jgi:SAM-dependent methyltransferase